MTRGSDSTSRLEGSASPLKRKKQIRDASIKPKKKANQKTQRNISSLKSKCKEPEEKRSASMESDEPQDNVDDQFGGRKGKKQKMRYE